jgi:hypothetical protein
VTKQESTLHSDTRHFSDRFQSRLCRNPDRVFPKILVRRRRLIIRARGRVLATDEKPQTQAFIASINGPTPMMAITRFRL